MIFSNAMCLKIYVCIDEVDSVICVFTSEEIFSQCAGKFYRFRHQTISAPAPIPILEKSAVLELFAVNPRQSLNNCLRSIDRYRLLTGEFFSPGYQL